MLPQPPPSEKEKKTPKKTKTNSPLHPSRPPPKLPKISVVNKSPNEEEHLNSGAKWKKYVNIGQYVFKPYEFKIQNFYKMLCCILFVK